jgi:limonene-1,2-epoxide hydrolase
VVGHEGLATTLSAFLAPAGEVDWQILTQFEIGSTVINERLDRFQIGDGWLELPIAGVFHIDDDGKIALWRDYFDMGSYMRQYAELTAE